MFKKKRNLIFASCLVGLLATTTATTLALSSCKTNSSPSKPDNPTNPDTPSTPDTPAKPDETPYTSVIDWSDKNLVNSLITDDNGLVYSDNTKTVVIAVKPEVTSSTIKIPSKVKSIMGYTRVVYQDKNGTIHESIPNGDNTSNYTKVKQLYGAFENMKSLQNIALESGSQLENIGKLAFLDCTSLTSIEGTANNLKYIGVSSFSNCTRLQSINTSSVTRVDDNAFSNCTSLSKIDLSNTLAIGNRSFYNCSNLTSFESLEKLTTIDKEAFYNATKNNAGITLKLSNLKSVSDSAFSGVEGISSVDFSNNNALTEIVNNAFINSSITNVDFSGCSKLSAIDQRAFENCKNLTTVYLPASNATSLESIGWNAFAKCTSLTTIAPKGSDAGFISTSKLSSIGTNALANTAITLVDLSSFAVNNNSNAPLGSETSLAFIPSLTTVKLPSTLATLNAGLFYGSGINGAGFSLDLPSSITNIIYSTSTSISNANSNDTSAKISVANATPFTNSGINSIDMSKITSYQLAANNITSVPSYLFCNATKLTSVILKDNTTAIGNHAFQGTTSLKSITYSSSSSTNSTTGFKASSNLSTIGTDAFKGAFSTNSNATVDLSAMKITSAPAAFDSSKVTNFILPTTITTIPANSFDNMTKLASFNFADLTNLQQITAPNFNNNQLTSIDLSNVQNPSNLFNSQDSSNKLFTGLPASCVVSLPSVEWNFSDTFLDASSQLVLLSYPKGIPFSSVNADGVFSFNSNYDTNKIKNIKDINISNNSTIMSIGPNTFFDNSNLSSITLNAKGISGGIASTKQIGLFSTTQVINANTSNTTNPTQYTKNCLPFGNNTKLNSLNYVGFTLKDSVDVRSDNQATLFNKTDQITWAEISKIINSLSYQPTDGANASAIVTANMSEWVAYNNGGKPANPDITNSVDGRTGDMVLKNLYDSSTDTSGKAKHFNASTTKMTFFHNGATWVYTNDGSSIKLTSTVNMYRLTDGTPKNPKNYLVYFNQIIDSPSGSSNAYYIPGGPITVTLTVATK